MKLLKFLMVFLLSLMLVGCEADDGLLNNGLLGSLTTNSSSSIDLNSIPKYNGEEFVAINNNVPNFDDKDKTTTSFETYSPLDSLGRCGEAYANIGRDLMPTQKRGDISSVKPSGWINKKYDTSLVDGGYIYNRCHLIGHQLAGEDANKENLITGTRYFNVDGMLPFENMIADYVKETNNHVLYRVTPIYDGDDLVAKGVQMEAYSVEDDGEGVMFNVFVYNVQPGIEIDYVQKKDQFKIQIKTTKIRITTSIIQIKIIHLIKMIIAKVQIAIIKIKIVMVIIKIQIIITKAIKTIAVIQEVIIREQAKHQA